MLYRALHFASVLSVFLCPLINEYVEYYLLFSCRRCDLVKSFTSSIKLLLGSMSCKDLMVASMHRSLSRNQSYSSNPMRRLILSCIVLSCQKDAFASLYQAVDSSRYSSSGPRKIFKFCS